MHGSFDKSGETTDKSIYRSWGIGVFAFPVLLVIALVGLAMTHPSVSSWISDAALAEFTGANYGPEAAPTRLAQPVREIHAVKAN